MCSRIDLEIKRHTRPKKRKKKQTKRNNGARPLILGQCPTCHTKRKKNETNGVTTTAVIRLLASKEDRRIQDKGQHPRKNRVPNPVAEIVRDCAGNSIEAGRSPASTIMEGPGNDRKHRDPGLRHSCGTCSVNKQLSASGVARQHWLSTA